MAVARAGSGIRADLRAMASQIHPVFMLPPVATAWFGAILAGEFSLWTGSVHALAIFAAVYTAHVKDGYVDFYRRDEDEDHPLSRRGCRRCLFLATAVFWTCVVALLAVAGRGAAALTAPTWAIGYLHAPQLDVHPIGATLGYPVGIGLALLGGYYVQAGTPSPASIALALIFVVLLAGIKIIDDEQDVRFDRSIEKRTVAVLIGPRRARILATGCLLAAAGLLGISVLAGTLPPGTLPAGAILVGMVGLTARRDPQTSTAILVRGSYLFLAILIAAVWFAG